MNKKIRLLLVTAETFPTFRVDVNVLFGKYLPQHGILSDIVTGKTPGKDEPPFWDGGEVYLTDISGGSARKHTRKFLNGIKHLFKVDTVRYDAIQVRDLPLVALIGLLMARIKGLKFFYWKSYPFPDANILLARQRGLSEGLMKFLFPWVNGYMGKFILYRLVLRYSDHVFVQSDRMKADLVGRGINSEKLTPVPMGVDFEAMQDLAIVSTDDERLRGKRVLVYLGLLDLLRKIETLFEMLIIVKRQFPNVLLILVGDAYEKSHLRWLHKKAEEAGVSDNLLWTGWLSMHEAWSYVLTAEVSLSPIPRSSLLDCSSPTKLIEYLALGIPPVCNDNPDQEQVIKESRAGICVPYTADDFANAVIKLLSMDANERNGMIKRGKDYVSQHRSYQKIASQLAVTYKKVLLVDDHGSFGT